MKRRIAVYAMVFGLTALLISLHWIAGRMPIDGATRSAGPVSPDAHARKLLLQYCGSCHEGGRTTFDFDMSSLQPAELQRRWETWELAIRKLRDQKMPPRKSTQPTAAERTMLIQWLEENALKPYANAGPLRARRLLRAEYRNVVRDLLGGSMDAGLDLPADETTWTLCHETPALAPDHIVQYRQAARRLLQAAFAGTSQGTEADGEESCVASGRSPRPNPLVQALAGGVSVRDFLGSFARRAYREPVDAAELDRLTALFERERFNGTDFVNSISAVMEEVMTSPRFLHRVDVRESDSSRSAPAPCGEIELASRLSFFLWSSAPDDELLNLAEANLLRENLEMQIQRMLRHPRSKAFASQFADDWLGLNRLDVCQIDDNLRGAMKKETRLFVAAVVREDRSVLELLDADFTFLNEPLARHYGIPDVQGDQFRRVSLQGTGRGGLLTQASILTLTSQGTQTSPVIRGRWILENLLGESIADPPADVTMDRDALSRSGNSLFTNAVCAQCHAKMDPFGYTLENFDPLGRWRLKKDDAPIDSTGVLLDGETLQGPAELKAYLVRQQDRFIHALAARLLGYARGRSVNDGGGPVIADVAERMAAEGYPFSRVVSEVVQSAAFQVGQRGSISVTLD